MLLEQNLKIIKDAKLDIEILRRKNEVLCADNNNDIEQSNYIIREKEMELEALLKESNEKKLECKLGYCSYREMPDKWEYDKEKFLYWLKGYHKDYDKYVKVEEILRKQAIKEDYLANPLLSMSGITVTPQEPKFNYKIK